MKYRLAFTEIKKHDDGGECRNYLTTIIYANDDENAKKGSRKFIKDNTPIGEGDDDVVRLEVRILERIDREEETTLIPL